MNAVKSFFKEVRPIEYALFFCSVAAILLSFFLTGNTDYVQLAASLVGVLALILMAKGNVAGQILSVIFAIFYGVVSYFCKYYGELIICLGMSAPVSLLAVISWLKNPFGGKKTEVEIRRLKLREYPVIVAISLAVSTAFFFILRALGTPNVWWSTVSVFTSCAAMLLSVRRSPLYAFAYCFNDIVLIVLWSLMSATDKSYLAMVVCFSVFLANDIYGLINWVRLLRKQQVILEKESVRITV